ncbi:MAG: G1 family glutamic endopeptidase [Acidimicrobiales bacterium]
MSRFQIIGLAMLAVFAAGAAAASGATTTHGRAGASALRFGSVVAARDGSTSTSTNWSGYAVQTTGAASGATFSNVFGTWIQPAVTCTAGQESYSAFWVGLGGFDPSAKGLEQTGTAADCESGLTPTYYAWYELIPAASVRVKLAVNPGDSISAAVTVSGRLVRFRIRNLTQHTVFNKKLRTASLDLSSAELIAEAPSACNASNRCHQLPLANFGTMTFTGGAATAAKRSATFDDPSWFATRVDLQQENGTDAGQIAPGSTPASVVPTALGANGSFSVTWQPASAPPPAP